jgi:hypothetical protein
MKIVNRKEFLKMPIGTVFSEFDGYNFNDMLVKHETIDNGIEDIDYWEMSMIANLKNKEGDDYCDTLERIMKEPVETEISLGRNGLFDQDQLYAIYETEDIDLLIQILRDATINKNGRSR